ncbi:MAG: glycosyltransferase family 4 protein [Synergistales bacterium]|nr:glycosyltransferase family 4 protein [Synergistales bacterium]
MKIWWLNHHARPPVVPGITRHYSLARELGKLGHSTMVVNSSFDHLGTMLPEGPEFGASLEQPLLREFDGVDFLSIPTPGYEGNSSLGRIRNMHAFYRRSMDILKTERYGKPDIVIGSVVHTWGAFAGYKLAKHFHVPFVYELRDLWPLTLVELGGLNRFHPLVLYFDHLDRIMVQEASLVITSAPLMKNYYKERWNIPEEKFLWITNGTDLEAFKKVRQNAREEKNTTKIEIYYTGSLGYANAVTDLVDVLIRKKGHFDNIHFHLYGSGPLKEKLEKISEDSELNLTIKDPVAKNQIPELLMKADVLFFSLKDSPIFRYGISPNKLADYHAAGKPILIVGNFAANPVIEAGSGISIPSFQDLPEALEKLSFAGSEELEDMGQKGFEYAVENYDWAQLAEKLNFRLSKLASAQNQRS